MFHHSFSEFFVGVFVTAFQRQSNLIRIGKMKQIVNACFVILIRIFFALLWFIYFHNRLVFCSFQITFVWSVKVKYVYVFFGLKWTNFYLSSDLHCTENRESVRVWVCVRVCVCVCVNRIGIARFIWFGIEFSRQWI